MMRRSRFHSLLCLWAACTTAVGGCRTAGTVKPTPGAGATGAPAQLARPSSSARPAIKFDQAKQDAQLVLSLPDPKIAKSDAVITTLAPAASDAMFARVEKLPDLAAQNAASPTMRAPTLPPPRPGPSHPIAFVVPAGKAVGAGSIPAGKPPAPEVKPLPPPQISPQDEVRAESEVRIRFSEAMVPVAAVATPAKAPATITPNVAGTWRWIDTRVVQFTSTKPRLPAATEFVVTVPAGARAINGSTLREATKATFRTPPISVTDVWPGEVRPDAAIAILFDQPFDPAKIIPLLRVTAPKRKQLAFRTIDLPAAQKLWANNPSLASSPTAIAKALGKHYVLIAPTSAWPAGSDLTVELKAGAPSLEGPLVSKRPSFTSFQVVPRFTAIGLACVDMKRPRLAGGLCPAKSYFELVFSNNVDLSTYRSSKVQIEGEPFADNQLSGAAVGLTAPAAVGRALSISIAGGLVDVYGQPYVGARRATFTTGMERFEAGLDVPRGVHILDPRFEIPQWVIATQAVASLRVQLFSVQPADYFAFEAYEDGSRATPPGKRIHDKTYVVGARNGADLRVDLRPALGSAGVGHVLAIATAVPIRKPSPDEGFDPKAVAWIQVTKLGASARVDAERVTLWVRDIAPKTFLAPIGGATASLIAGPRASIVATTTTDAQGQATFELPPSAAPKPQQHSLLMHVKSGADTMFTAYHGRSERAARVHDALWYVTDDRFTYKPGEKAYFKGWVRWTHDGVNPELALPTKGEGITYTLADGRGNKIATGTAPLTEQGGFDIEVALPATMNLGTATLSMQTRTERHSHLISVQEFRAPPYSVSLNDDVQHRGAVPLILGENIEMTTEAKYYAGGGLAGADVSWSISLDPTTFKPAGWDRFTFTPPRKRSHSWRDDHEGAIREAREGSLSGASSASIVVGATTLVRNRPSILSVDVTVSDVDRMRIRASSRPILVHPSAYYVGVRLRPSSKSSGDALEAVVTDIDGSLVEGVPIEIAIEAVLGSESYRDDANVTDTQSCKLTSSNAPVSCPWVRRDTKYAYTAVARIADGRGRTNTTQLEIPWWEYADRVNDFSITPDRAIYRPGEVAKLEIMSKVLPATAIVSFARQGVFAQKRVELTQASTTIELPIEPAFIQNVHVIVDRIGKRRQMQAGSTLPLPEHTQVSINLPVELESARLEMRTRPLVPLVEPGENATFEVEVRHEGKPKPNAEVALIVVDEAVLSLSAKKHEDPLAPFYREVAEGTSQESTFHMVYDSGDSLKGGPGFTRYKLDESARVQGGSIGYGAFGSGSGGSGSGYGFGSGRGGLSSIKVRKDFRANAVFSPRLKTDANGKVKLTVAMPDSLTRFRIIALATSDTRYFGKAENVIVTQLKVNARSVAPRFLTQGDQFSLPVIVQNLGTTPRTVDVAARAANLEAVGPAGKRITIPAGQRAEVRFDFKTRMRGRAIVQTVMVSGDLADASNVELPVYEPATTESFATYGIVDDKPQFEQLAVPASIFPDVGGVQVELASTQLQSLTDAYWYLYAYPYECAEQRSSRMIATAAMADILDAFAVPGRPTKQDITQQLAKDLRLLQNEQGRDGGWGYFRTMRSDPYVSMQVLTALAMQKVKGSVVTQAIAYTRKKADTLLAKLEASVKQPPIDRTNRDELPYHVSLAAAALSALAVAGVDIRGHVDRLHAAATTLETYPIDAKARVLSLLAKQGRAKAVRSKLLTAIVSATHETAAAATVTASYVESERLLLVSSSKTTALALDAMMLEAPQHALIPKLARGLLDGRQRGRWGSTQENVVVLATMRRYFDIYEKVTPNYTGKLWFGTAAYAQQPFVGRSNQRGVVNLDWTQLPSGSSHDISLVKEGPGRMYYRVGITYAPKQTNLPALDAGFIVRRSYTAVDDPADVTQLPNGRWRVRLGARVLVTVAALNTTRRHAVALVDPLPAGFEAVNDNLATAERSVTVADQARWDYVNMRDNRSEAFMMQAAEGSHRFSYTARATTPGTFLAAPAKAEEMYSPETFGRSASQVVVIE